MADRVTVSNSSASINADFTVLTDEVTDATLGTGQKQMVGIMDGTINGTDKLIVTAAGAAKVDGSAVTQPVTVSSTIAAARTTDTVSAALATDAIMSSTTALTPKFSTIVASASGVTTIVAAVASKKIRVLSWNLVTNGAVNVKWQSATTPTDKTGLHYFGANGGISVVFSPVGHFETISGEALTINLSGAVAVGGSLVYVEV